jgi:hypothetical protein
MSTITTLAQSKDKRILMVWLAFCGVILYLFSNMVIKFYEKYIINDHQEVEIYLEKLDLYNHDSTQIVESIHRKFYSLNEDEYNIQVKTAQDDLKKIIDQTYTLTAPQGFNHHKDVFLAVITQRMNVISAYNKTRKTYIFLELNKSIEELNQRQHREKSELLKTFKKDGIKYRILGDGSIRYWYKSNSAKFIL